MSEHSLLETRNLVKTFGNLVANDEISLSVREGEIHGLIGPNGSGKSTFFNVITGFLQPNEGKVVFDGTEITGWQPHRIATGGLGRTFQIVSPFENMTVEKNMLAVHSDGDLAERKERAAEILDFLEIDHIAHDEASDMSGGQQKLLELGRILMLDPKCILLDEPCAGVNPALEQRILDRLRTLNEQGTTILIIEHDMNIIETLADRVTVFSQGRNIVDGTFDEVQSDARVREAYLGDDMQSSQPTTDPGAASKTETSDASTKHDGTLVAENIVAGYGAHQVINDVSIRSHDGITCILGPNGSGKSTLLKTLNGIVPVWSGTVTFNDKEITDLPSERITHKGIMTLPQGGGAFGRMTIKENLQLGGNMLDEDESVAQRMEVVLDEFPPLQDKLGETAASLSGGQQMMLSFGRAMMSDADVYLLDEPSAGLAPDLVNEVIELVQTLANDGAEVILIEQNVRAALRVADHVYIIAQGEIQFDGKQDELDNEDELVELYLGIEQ